VTVEITDINIKDWRITVAMDPIEARRLALVLDDTRGGTLLPGERDEDLANHLYATMGAALQNAVYALYLLDHHGPKPSLVEWKEKQQQKPEQPPTDPDRWRSTDSQQVQREMIERFKAMDANERANVIDQMERYHEQNPGPGED
jgi:hypothetical protein